MPDKKQKTNKPTGPKPGYGGNQHWALNPSNKTHKCKISKIEDDIFEIGAVNHASQFSKLLLNVTDYLQIKYNDDVAEAIWLMEEQVFNYPEKPKDHT